MRLLIAALVCAVGAGCGRPEAPASSPDPTPQRPTPQAPDRVDTRPPAPVVDVAAPAEPVVERRGVVVLAPLGSFPPELIDEIETTLRREFDVDVRRLDPRPLPKSAYYRPRRRYRADRLIDHLLSFVADEPETTRVLGLTEVDISTTKGKHADWGVFGLGYAPGQSAVISSFRLRRKASPELLRRRVANTALHEVGHTFGLPHCTEARCFMQDAEGSIANTDSSTGKLGGGCEATLDRMAPRRPRP